jgi:Carboxypeptidase regulatory-like domain/Uncharacterized protein conserved in bacteria (DUF2135)
LLEKTVGNNFRARIYPIPANGTKRVVIAYEQELQGTGGLFYQLPLRFTQPVDHFELKADVYQQEQAPELKSGMFRFQVQGSNWHGESRAEHYTPDQTLAFIVPKSQDSTTVYQQQDGVRRYFCANVELPESRDVKTLPRRLIVAWDASASAAQRDLKKELDLLQAYLKVIGSVELKLVVFRNEAETLRHFRIVDGHSDELRTFLESLRLDGGTQLGSLDLGRVSADEILLFGDGISTLGRKYPILPKRTPLIAVNSLAGANTARLRQLSEGSGGHFVDLATLKPEEALESLKHQPLAFLGWSGAPGDIHEVYPSCGTPVRGAFSLTGLQILEKSRITLHFGYGGKVRFDKTLELDSRQTTSGTGVSRLWAQKKLAELQVDPEANREAILALGHEHNLVTDGTSLIVLESVQDHIQYRIPPPPEWKAEYEQAIQAQDRQKRNEENSRLENLASKFQELKVWWDKRFQKDAPKSPAPTLVSMPASTPTRSVQTQSGGINGIVLDEAGNPIVAARIVLESPNLFLNLTLMTDSRGEYRSLLLPAGNYTVQVSAAGFLGKIVRDVRIGMGTNISIPFKMKRANLPEATSTVEVVSTSVSESRSDDKISTNFSAEKLLQLPTGGGPSFAGALGATPGITGSRDAASTKVRGSETNQVMYRVNGVNVRNDSSGRTALNSPSQDVPEDHQASAESAPASASIELKPWTSDAPYLVAIKAVAPGERYEAYLNLRKAYGSTPGFYLDMADLFEGWKEHALAVRIISNLAELKLDEASLLRILGRRLELMGEHELAISIFEQVLRIREEEPQSYRDLALACEAAGQSQRALDLLSQILVRKWDGRFPDIDLNALVELNGIASRHKVDTRKVDPRLICPMPMDIRVVLNWDTDNSDMDLWVTDPSGEKCLYSHNRTLMGGRITADCTQGYGPESFMQKMAEAGVYKIQTNYFGTRQQTAVIGPTTLHVELYLHYGTPQQTRKDMVLRLGGRGAVVDVGTFQFSK